MRSSLAVRLAVALALGAGPARAAAEETVALVVGAGTPLRVALDQRVRVKRVGQPVTATVLEPVYAFDRVVIPAGATVLGHFKHLEPPPKGVKVRSMLGGDFSAPRAVVIDFTTLALPDGRAFSIDSVAANGTENVAVQVAGGSGGTNVVAQARQQIAKEAGTAPPRRPGPVKRALWWVRDDVFGRLPLHPQYLRADTVYSVKLASPLSFGVVTATERAAAGMTPAPGSILTARLLTPLHSARTTASTPIEAVVTRPVFSAENRLLLPEGTRLSGEVTLARAARRFHQNGQLRVLFDTVQPPEGDSRRLMASLHSVEAGRAGRVALDEEGGATATSSDARFVAPVLASLALAASLRQHLDYDTDGAGPEVAYGSTSSYTAGGFFGLGLLGVGIAQIWRPAGVALGIIGFTRTFYSAIAGKGHDVAFPADTPIQVQLAPGPSPSPSAAPGAGAEPTKGP